MHTPNSLPSERIAVVGGIDPDAYASGAEVSSGWIRLGPCFSQAMALISVGDIASTGKVDAKIEQADTSTGNVTVKDVSGKAITQLTQAGTDSNKQAIINLAADELDISNGFEWFRLTMNFTTAGADAGATILGFDPRYSPASDHDAATVDEIVP